MATRPPISIGEWYHCYNRGVDKRHTFTSKAEYERFLTLLYLCNGTNTLRLAERYDPSFRAILMSTSLDRGELLVEVGAYTVMPNHFHLLLKEVQEGGIALFMQKVSTGYTMYFNKKHERAGSLFAGTFKSRHVNDDRYLKQVVAYILLNPAELFELKWKEGKANLRRLKSQLLAYEYSNFSDFLGEDRVHGKIVSDLSDYYDKKPTLATLVEDAFEYYQEHSPKV